MLCSAERVWNVIVGGDKTVAINSIGIGYWNAGPMIEPLTIS